MIAQDDFERLFAQDSEIELAGLEQDIWRQVALRRTSRTLASWQAAVLALGIFGSAAIGVAAAASLAPAPKLGLLGTGQEMAPSTLLFGKNQ